MTGKAALPRPGELAPGLPRRVTLTVFAPKGCLFEVTTPIEEGRVLGLGAESEFLGSLPDDIRPGGCFFDMGSCVGPIVFTPPSAVRQWWPSSPTSPIAPA